MKIKKRGRTLQITVNTHVYIVLETFDEYNTVKIHGVFNKREYAEAQRAKLLLRGHYPFPGRYIAVLKKRVLG